MARKSDLLTLLSKRSADPAPAARPSEKVKGPPMPPGRSPSGASLGASIQASFRKLLGKLGKPAPAPTAGLQQRPPVRPALPTQVQLPMFGLVAVVVCALGLGFVLGRAFGGRPDPTRGTDEQALRTQNGKQGIEAGWLVPAESPRSPEMQTQVMANWYLPVILYEAHLKADALHLAEYLQENQIKTARIRYFENVPTPDDSAGKPCWATVVYVPSREKGAAFLEELRKVPAPTFETKFQDSLTTLQGWVASGKAPFPHR